ncbi:MAG: hypothetical protein OEY79_01595 [Anaplasmataceae bacterium]|nr:hypothetical protein [Anaplasmataceae bacterium]
MQPSPKSLEHEPRKANNKAEIMKTIGALTALVNESGNKLAKDGCNCLLGMNKSLGNKNQALQADNEELKAENKALQAENEALKRKLEKAGGGAASSSPPTTRGIHNENAKMRSIRSINPGISEEEARKRAREEQARLLGPPSGQGRGKDIERCADDGDAVTPDSRGHSDPNTTMVNTNKRPS